MLLSMPSVLVVSFFCVCVGSNVWRSRREREGLRRGEGRADNYVNTSLLLPPPPPTHPLLFCTLTFRISAVQSSFPNIVYDKETSAASGAYAKCEKKRNVSLLSSCGLQGFPTYGMGREKGSHGSTSSSLCTIYFIGEWLEHPL